MKSEYTFDDLQNKVNLLDNTAENWYQYIYVQSKLDHLTSLESFKSSLFKKERYEGYQLLSNHAGKIKAVRKQ